MSNIKCLDLEFETFIPEEKIQKEVKRVAKEISKDMQGKDPLFLVILNGAFMFASDLFKNIHTPCEISFTKFSSYEGTSSTNKVKKLIGLNEDIENRHLVIVEDIVDTGQTMEVLMEDLRKKNPASISIATCFFKKEAFTKNYPVHYIGMDISNDFILGYGLDYNGFGRNYPDIYKLKK